MATDPPLPNLTVQQLEYLDAVTRAPTWAAAAEEVGVSPSALSQGLAELERRVGIPLFERDGRRRRVRPQAGEVTRYAADVLARTRDLARWSAATRGARRGTLRLGLIDVAAVVHFPGVLRAFRRERPELDLHLAVAPSSTLLTQLRAGHLDLVVCVDPPGQVGDLVLTPLVDEPLGLYAPEGRRAGPASGWGPWVTFPEGSHTRTLILDALRTAGAPVAVVAESHQPDVLREMVRLGLGWTVLPIAQAEAQPDPLRRARRTPLTTRRLVAARRRGAPADPVVTGLLHALGASPVSAAGDPG